MHESQNYTSKKSFSFLYVKTMLKMKMAKELSRRNDLLQNIAKNRKLKNFKKKYNKKLDYLMSDGGTFGVVVVITCLLRSLR